MQRHGANIMPQRVNNAPMMRPNHQQQQQRSQPQTHVMAQNRIIYRSSRDPNDFSMRLLRELNEGGCIKYFRLDCYDGRNPPEEVKYFPSMYIIGAPKLLVGEEAFIKARELIAQEKGKRSLEQQMSVQYHQKRMLLQQQLTNSRDNLLGFSEREMTNFSDSYSTVTPDTASFSQSFKSPLQNVKVTENGEIVMVDGIMTPQLNGSMGADEQLQRITMLKAERDKQRSTFENGWEADRQMKLQQLSAGQPITSVSQPNQFPIQTASVPATMTQSQPQSAPNISASSANPSSSFLPNPQMMINPGMVQMQGGMMNSGMVNQGMMNPGMMNPGMMMMPQYGQQR